MRRHTYQLFGPRIIFTEPERRFLPQVLALKLEFVVHGDEEIEALVRNDLRLQGMLVSEPHDL